MVWYGRWSVEEHLGGAWRGRQASFLASGTAVSQRCPVQPYGFVAAYQLGSGTPISIMYAMAV